MPESLFTPRLETQSRARDVEVHHLERAYRYGLRLCRRREVCESDPVECICPDVSPSAGQR